jgi:pyruvate dehydrogenase E2 component (dihydrolipoamide acetyltransferase)
MALGVYLPIWGLQMEEGTVVKWLVSEGERVEKEDPLVEIETEKITNVVESPAAGIIARILAREGEVVKVTGLLAVIAREGENRTAMDAVLTAARPGEERAQPTEVAPQTKRVSSRPTPSSPLNASPLAKKIAQAKGIDLSQVKGTGPQGMIVKEDVLAHEEGLSMAQTAASGARLQAEGGPFDGEIIPMSQTRKVIARRTLESIRAPQGTLTREVDLSQTLRFRESIQSEFERLHGIRLALTPIFVKAVARAAREVPILNSRIQGDQIHVFHQVHVGVVVGIKDGIVIPVIFNAHSKSLADVAKDWEGLSRGATDGTLRLDQITGSTITISNVGNVGIDLFTPILNPPESAVLGITRTRQRPIVTGGEIAIGEMAYLCLTGDHRVMDAEPIARFLIAVERILSNPIQLLI